MRATVTLDQDTYAAVEQLSIEEGLSVSEAVNALIRRGLYSGFAQRTHELGLRIDVSNVAEALQKLEGADST